MPDQSGPDQSKATSARANKRRQALGIPAPPVDAAVEARARAPRPHHIALGALALFGAALALVLIFWQPGPKGDAVAEVTPPVSQLAMVDAPRPVPPPERLLAPDQLPLFEPEMAPEADIMPEVEPQPAWRRHAVKMAGLDSGDSGAPKLAIILDDMGPDRRAVKRAAHIKGPLTLAFLPYARSLPRLTAYARDHGHELMVHLPMEPKGRTSDPGPNALILGLDRGELERRIAWNLDQFGGFVGLNNHMGSRFTAHEAEMRLVMEVARDRGLLFVDSRTTEDTVGEPLATRYGIPTRSRDIFLDNVRDERAIRAQLMRAVRIAETHGSAIAIGHPYAETFKVLERDLPRLTERGLVLVPVSALVRAPAAIQTAEKTP